MGAADAILTVPEAAERGQIEQLKAWRAARDNNAVAAALKELKRAATRGTNIMPASIACAKAGVTTGEWGWTLRETFGDTGHPLASARHAQRRPPASTIFGPMLIAFHASWDVV